MPMIATHQTMLHWPRSGQHLMQIRSVHSLVLPSFVINLFRLASLISMSAIRHIQGSGDAIGGSKDYIIHVASESLSTSSISYNIARSSTSLQKPGRGRMIWTSTNQSVLSAIERCPRREEWCNCHESSLHGTVTYRFRCSMYPILLRYLALRIDVIFVILLLASLFGYEYSNLMK